MRLRIIHIIVFLLFLTNVNGPLHANRTSEVINIDNLLNQTNVLTKQYSKLIPLNFDYEGIDFRFLAKIDTTNDIILMVGSRMIQNTMGKTMPAGYMPQTADSKICFTTKSGELYISGDPHESGNCLILN